ncbi:WD40-repeat containing protein [Chondrus crispus]|uniref:WD40-repeat containing protein n=1 Tax=Chondrus crispus TaxID=2769 RepID=R7Q775_CHOCR|nr:WD40-repeat containing protein [Chondrus crispus]CDF33320.1 WD40-repeat containing protein [Chondrus crispus]|eukprot:XP_005713123.1 WD40-repeat containing protein [Chondrus crispus]
MQSHRCPPAHPHSLRENDNDSLLCFHPTVSYGPETRKCVQLDAESSLPTHTHSLQAHHDQKPLCVKLYLRHPGVLPQTPSHWHRKHILSSCIHPPRIQQPLRKLSLAQSTFYRLLSGTLRFHSVVELCRLRGIMDPLSILELVGAVEQVVSLVQKAIDTHDAYKNNGSLATKVLKQYLELQKLTENVANVPIHDLEPLHKNELQAQVQVVSRSVSGLVKELKDETENPKGKLHALASATGVRDVLLQRQQEAEKLYASIDNVRKELHGVRETRRQGSRVVREIRSHAPVGDVFKPSFAVEFNPSTVLIDLKSTCRGCTDPDTVERKLKAAVLSTRITSHVGATAVGQAGVGKTCALRAIAHDEEVVKRFPGGVYFSTLGKDAREAELKQRLCDVVRISGGREQGDKLSNLADLDGVLTGVKSWFSDHQCLFIFDDIWSRNNNDEKILLKLSSLASTAVRNGQPASKVLYSTRDPTLSHLGEQVKFEPREGPDAYDILIHTSGASRGEVENPISREAFREILDMCAGLPLALNVAGASVKQSRGDLAGDVPKLWTLYLKTIKESPGSGTIGAQEARGGYKSLYAMLRSSLQHLDSHDSEESPSFSKMHRALCVMKKQTVMPLAVLRDLWGAGDVNIARKYATQMESVGLVDIGVLADTTDQGIRLHDLTHDFAVSEAQRVEGPGWTKHWCRELIDSYRKERDVLEAVVEDQVPKEASEAEEGYFFENICRLLVGAELMKELGCLLLSSRWILKVLLRKAVWQLVEAVEELRKLASEKPEAIASEQLSAIVLVMQAARLSVSSCDESVAGICFQLYSRAMHKRGVKSVESFLLDIEKFAPRPWLLPIRSCLTAAGGRLLETFYIRDSCVKKVMFDSDGAVVGLGYDPDEGSEDVEVFKSTQHGAFNRTVCGPFRSEDEGALSRTGSETQMARTSQAAAEGQRPTARTSRAAAESRHPTQRGAWIRTVGKMLSERMAACSCFRRAPENDRADGGADADVSDDGTSRVTGSDSADSVTPGVPFVTAACLSADSTRAVIGFSNGDLISWCTREHELVQSFKGHSDTIYDVVMSGDGKRIASGSGDETVRVWDAETGRQIGHTMTGHTDWVTSVSMSGDGKRVASGSYDKTVRVWDAETGRQIGDTMTGHTNCVTSVSMSGDGKRVASGSRDETVRVWDAETGRQIGDTMTGHTNWVTSVSMSGDGKRVASGSDDKTVRVWDAETGRQIGDTMTGHTSLVTSVSMSGDGKRVASGSRDKTVRVWDAETGRQIGDTMTGHTDWVTSVSMSGDGKRVASGSVDETVRVWDAETGRQIGDTMNGHTSWVRSVSMSADSQKVRSVSFDGTVLQWKARPGVSDLQWKAWPGVSDMDQSCETNAHEFEGHVRPLDAFGIVSREGRAFVKQGDGTEITLADFGSPVSTFDMDVERGTVAVGMESGMFGILTVVTA